MRPSVARSGALSCALLLAPAGASARVSAPPGEPPTSAAREEAGAKALDVVLPCGLRVLVARDSSLPVAAVVLALELGAEDDPPALEGLHHALGYLLLEGNRELAPHAAVGTVHDAGGIVRIGAGAAQLRFESVFPSNRLDAVLWNESQRLRAPTVNEAAWRRALAAAGNDHRRAPVVTREAVAAAHGDVASLAHDGRRVSTELRKLSLDKVAAALQAEYRYSRATLVVVSPEPPAAVLARVKERFAALPAAARGVTPRPRPPLASALEPAPKTLSNPPPTPRVLEVGRRRGQTLVWPVSDDPAVKLAAEALCEAINRQRPGPDEPRSAQLRCHHEADARRGTLNVRPLGTQEPVALATARLERLLSGPDRRLLETVLTAVLAADRHRTRTPLGSRARWPPASPTSPTSSAPSRPTRCSGTPRSPIRRPRSS